jgi:hypothetical protein
VLSKPRSRLLYDRLAYRGPGGGFGPAHPGVGKPTRETAPISDDELVGWVFAEDPPDLKALVLREDRLIRYLAAAALLVSIVVPRRDPCSRSPEKQAAGVGLDPRTALRRSAVFKTSLVRLSHAV